MDRSQQDIPDLGSGLKTAQVLEGPAGCVKEAEEQVELLEPPAAELELPSEPAARLTFLLQTNRNQLISWSSDSSGIKRGAVLVTILPAEGRGSWVTGLC